MDGSTVVTIPIEFNHTPILGTQLFFEGKFNGKDCVLQASTDDLDRYKIYRQLVELKPSPSTPSPLLVIQDDHHFPHPFTILDLTYTSLDEFLGAVKHEYNLTRKQKSLYVFSEFEDFLKRCFAGILDILQRGYVVRNFNVATAVISDSEGRAIPIFLDLVKKDETSSDVVVELAKDLRCFITKIFELSGILSEMDRVDQLALGASEAMLNFCEFATNEYIELVARVDPTYIFNDPVIWSYKEMVLRIWYQFMFIEDNVHSQDLRPYHNNFPLDWKSGIAVDSFLDVSITHQVKIKEERTAKIALADSLIEKLGPRNQEGGRAVTTKIDVGSMVETYDRVMDKVSQKRGLDLYNKKQGFRFVDKIKRNNNNHYNEEVSRRNKKWMMKTLSEIVKFIDDEIQLSSSRIHWILSSTWTRYKVPNWIYHMEMLKGEKCWGPHFLEERNKENAAKAAKRKRREEKKKMKEKSEDGQVSNRRQKQESSRING